VKKKPVEAEPGPREAEAVGKMTIRTKEENGGPQFDNFFSEN
jgi:hypothetical protein